MCEILMCEIEGHHLTSAAIVDHEGAAWAQTGAPYLASTGLFLGATKYTVIQGKLGAVIRGKKVFNCPSNVAT
ncbi:hypothetical protein ACJX0J_025440, partial [Zea mays]